jgi:hypothetical protein
LTPLALEGTPMVTARKDPGFDYTRYTTFSVFPLSLVNQQCMLKDEAAARPLLFMLRNSMEKLGYRFVQLSESPDLLLTIDASSDGGHENLPKEMNPPNLSAGVIPDPRVAAAVASPTYAAYGWGSWPPKPELIAPLPGYPPRGDAPSENRGAKFVFTYVTVAVVDAKTAIEVWTGAGGGISRNLDLAINSQLVLWSVMQQFPSARAPEILTGLTGVPGLHAEIFTNDGKHYFPSVTAVDSGSPGWRSGINPLDMIVAIDADSTADVSFAKFSERLGGPPDSSITVTVWRNGDQIQISVPREKATAPLTAENEPEANKEAKKETPHLDIPRTTVSYKQSVPLFGAVILLILTGGAVAGML